MLNNRPIYKKNRTIQNANLYGVHHNKNQNSPRIEQSHNRSNRPPITPIPCNLPSGTTWWPPHSGWPVATPLRPPPPSRSRRAPAQRRSRAARRPPRAARWTTGTRLPRRERTRQNGEGRGGRGQRGRDREQRRIRNGWDNGNDLRKLCSVVFGALCVRVCAVSSASFGRCVAVCVCVCISGIRLSGVCVPNICPALCKSCTLAERMHSVDADAALASDASVCVCVAESRVRAWVKCKCTKHCARVMLNNSGTPCEGGSGYGWAKSRKGWRRWVQQLERISNNNEEHSAEMGM